MCAIPEVGARLTQDFLLPTGETPHAGRHALRIADKPEQGKLLSVVNTLSSIDVAMFLQRLPSDDLRQLHQLGCDIKTHNLSLNTEHAPLVERLAESLHLVQSKSVLAVNFIGPDAWRGIIKNLDASRTASYAHLTERHRENLCSNVYSVARNLAALPTEALELIEDLRRLAPQGRAWVAPASSLSDYISKRAVDRNHHAWRFRKRLEGQPHDDSGKMVPDLDPRMRLFAGLMGLGTFQMLREAGADACHALIRLGTEILNRQDLDVPRLREDRLSKNLLVGVPFKDGSYVQISPDIMAHFRDYHHGLWLTNRTLSWLLPPELHQPRDRPEHTPVENLDAPTANFTCIHIIALATSLAQDARENSQVYQDLIKTAAPGNPFDLNAGLFNARGESL